MDRGQIKLSGFLGKWISQVINFKQSSCQAGSDESCADAIESIILSSLSSHLHQVIHFEQPICEAGSMKAALMPLNFHCHPITCASKWNEEPRFQLH